MSQETNWLHTAGTFALFAIGFLALCGVYFMYKSSKEANVRSFTVQGKGEVMVKPSKATVSATFFAEGGDQKQATEELVKKVDVMFKTFKELNSMKITPENIKTESVNVQPKYEYCTPDYTGRNPKPCSSEPKIIGYTATEYVTFSLSKNEDNVNVEDKAGKVLGILAELGARDVSGPAWESDKKESIGEARDIATKEAKAKAEAIAKSLGLRLGDVMYYNETQGENNYPVPMMAKAMSMDAAGAAESAVSVPVSVGEDKVVLSVDITYEMK